MQNHSVIRFIRLCVAALLAVSLATACGKGRSGSTPAPIPPGPPPPSLTQMGGSMQGNNLSLGPIVTTEAGVATGTDGIGAQANFLFPEGIASDGVNLYVADTYDHVIRKVVIATGEVTLLAGKVGEAMIVDGIGTAARFSQPQAVTTDGANVYVGDEFGRVIRKIVLSTGDVTTLAGTPGASGSADGIGVAARFADIRGLVLAGGALYISDSANHTIRQLNLTTNEVTTIAGTVGVPGSADGVGLSASFYTPHKLAADASNLYIADYNNCTIRRMDIATGDVTTLAGTAGVSDSVDGTGAAARFVFPRGVALSGTDLYVIGIGAKARKIDTATAVVTTLAGTGEQGSADGAPSVAQFSDPYGLATDGTNVYVADTHNYTIRAINMATGDVSTLVSKANSADGVANAARFKSPVGITTDGASVYITDPNKRTIRKMVIATGEVTTLAGKPDAAASVDANGLNARFELPQDVTTDGISLYIIDLHTIRRLDLATGDVVTMAGSPTETGSSDGIGAAARFLSPQGITTDGTSLYVSDTGNNTIRKIDIATANVITLAGSAGVSGSSDGVGGAASFNIPSGLTTDGTNLYIADRMNYIIRQVVIATGEVTTIAGAAGVAQYVDDVGENARFTHPWYVTSDGVNLYIAEMTGLVRKLDLATADVTTVAGAWARGMVDGPGADARFKVPAGITTDGVGLYISDMWNATIRAIH